MINPGSVAGQMPPGDDALIRMIQDLQRDVRELKAQDVLRTAGLIAAPNQLTVQGELDVTGPMVVGGTLSLPAGIIDNAALAHPLYVAFGTNSQSNFAVGTSFGDVAVAPVTIPAGFNSAVVMVFGKVMVYNAASASWLYIECGKAGDTFGGMAEPLPAGYSVHEMVGILTVSGTLAAGTLNTAVRISATPGLAANSANTAFTRSMAILYNA